MEPNSISLKEIIKEQLRKPKEKRSTIKCQQIRSSTKIVQNNNMLPNKTLLNEIVEKELRETKEKSSTPKWQQIKVNAEGNNMDLNEISLKEIMKEELREKKGKCSTPKYQEIKANKKFVKDNNMVPNETLLKETATKELSGTPKWQHIKGNDMEPNEISLKNIIKEELKERKEQSSTLKYQQIKASKLKKIVKEELIENKEKCTTPKWQHIKANVQDNNMELHEISLEEIMKEQLRKKKQKGISTGTYQQIKATKKTVQTNDMVPNETLLKDTAKIELKENKEKDGTPKWRQQFKANVQHNDMEPNELPLNEIMKGDSRGNKEKGSTRKYQQIRANTKMLQDLLGTEFAPKRVDGRAYSLETVETNSPLGLSIMSMFAIKKFSEKYKINKIQQIYNPYLLAQYELRKAEHLMSEQTLYHGTKTKYLDSICTYNFDWRRAEKCKYGSGVSFANNPYYASQYSTREHCTDEDYVMILAKVLIGRTCRGSPNLTCPKEGFDTTTNYDGQVLVKYDDCTFYPKFIIYFEEK